MRTKLVMTLPALAVLCGCETLQTPQQRQQQTARQQAAARMSEERMYKMQGQVESVEMEFARLTQEIQQLRQQVNACNSQINQLNSNMQALQAKQAREIQSTLSAVEQLMSKAAVPTSTSSSSRQGPGREHVVEKGHTLSAIAVAYGTTVDAIKKANNLKSDSIYVGQKLFIPE